MDVKNKKKSTAESLIDMVSGNGNVSDLIDSLTGSGSSTSKSKKKKSSSVIDTIVDSINGGSKYPALSAKSYNEIHEKFQKNVPESVTAASLANTLNLKTDTVKEEIIPSLKKMGLINSQAETTTLAKQWADDVKYEDACKKIVDDVYPSTVTRLPYKTKTDQRSLLSWFKKNTDANETEATKMMNCYLSLRTASVSAAASASSVSASKTKKSASSEKADSDVVVKKLQNGTTKITITVSVPEGTTQTDVSSLLSAASKKALSEYKK